MYRAIFVPICNLPRHFRSNLWSISHNPTYGKWRTSCNPLADKYTNLAICRSVVFVAQFTCLRFDVRNRQQCRATWNLLKQLVTCSEEMAVQYLGERNLLDDLEEAVMNCNKCGSVMQNKRRLIRENSVPVMRCPRKGCQVMRSVRHGNSFFHYSDLNKKMNWIVRFKKGISPKIKFFRNRKKLYKFSFNNHQIFTWTSEARLGIE
jgi:hypothetical protein